MRPGPKEGHGKKPSCSGCITFAFDDVITQVLLVISKPTYIILSCFVVLSLTLTPSCYLKQFSSSAVCIDWKNEPTWLHTGRPQEVTNGYAHDVAIIGIFLIQVPSLQGALQCVCSSVSVAYCREKAAMKTDEAEI